MFQINEGLNPFLKKVKKLIRWRRSCV